ncbi:MAG: hypothetical protein ACLQGP_35215 [Isosphaeraceae bacterium]
MQVWHAALNANYVLPRVLIVSAQVLVPGRGQSQVEFGDGILTGRGTFQTFLGQVELKTYIESVLQAEAIPAEIGVLYVFKEEAAGQQYLASRNRPTVSAALKRIFGGSVRGEPRPSRALHGDHCGPRAVAGGR